jgi:hypothetical protein
LDGGLVLSNGSCPSLRGLGRCCNDCGVNKVYHAGDPIFLRGRGDIDKGRSVASEIESLGVHLGNGQGDGG